MSDFDVQTPILMYHSISEAASAAFAPYVVTPAAFERHLAHIARSGREALTVGEYAAALRRRAPPEHAVVITFDDGFRDFLTAALPLLQRYRLRATLFVPTAYVGTTSGWLSREAEASRPLLDWTELREVRDAGVEIGSHSHTHAELDRLAPQALADELRRSKARLEQALATPVRTLAYPFGYHSRRVRDHARSSGYGAACQVGHRKSTLADDPFALNRLLVPASISDDAFALLLAAREPHLARVARGVRELGAATLRRLGPPRGNDG